MIRGICMELRSWDTLPPNMRNESVRKYYDIVRHRRFQLYLKRLFDISAAFLLLIILYPVLLVIAILVKVDSKGPILYRQIRVTQYGKKFRIVKFRTMIMNADKTGNLITTKNDSRITKVGKVLRKYRLDEIPQLFNIITGDMTFVGTRPEVVNLVKQYSDEMMATLLLPAGVTSEASIRFKNEASFLVESENAEQDYLKIVLPQKMKINLEAIEKYSFIRDIMTIIKTIGMVFKNE